MKLGNQEIKYLVDEKWTSRLSKLYLGMYKDIKVGTTSLKRE